MKVSEKRDAGSGGMMDRRSFFRRAALIGAGVIAADQLEIVERIGWTRRLFAGWSPRLHGDGIHDDSAAIQHLLDRGRGKLVTLPDGHYLITKPLIVHGGTVFDGGGHHNSLTVDMQCNDRHFMDRQGSRGDWITVRNFKFIEKNPPIHQAFESFGFESAAGAFAYNSRHVSGGTLYSLKDGANV